MFRKATLFTLVLAVIVVVFCSSVRLADGKGSCPAWNGWPGCYGEVSEVRNALVPNTLISSEIKKELKEWVSYQSVIITLGILALLLTISAWMQAGYRLAAVISSNLLLSVFGIQLVLAIWASKAKLMPVVVTGQLFLACISIWLLFWMYLRSNPKIKLNQQQDTVPKILARVAIIILSLQIILGFWVSTNQAGLACKGFPNCNGEWWPAVDYLSNLNLFSAFESGYTGSLSFNGQVAINWVHRIGAIISFIFLTIVTLIATSENYKRPIRKSAIALSVLLLVELMLGINNVKLELPVVIDVAHNLFAVLLMMALIAISFYSKYSFLDEVKEEKDDTSIANVDEVIVLDKLPSADSLYLRLKSQLKKTRTGIGGVIATIPVGQKAINQDLLEEIESSLLTADLGVETTTLIIAELTSRLERKQLNDGAALESALKQILLDILEPCNKALDIPKQDSPFVILVVGINGVGKTTTIGKLAKRLKTQGHSVMLAAGDTFRAAAVEQLQVWGERNDIQVVAQQTGADSASVIFDAVQSAQAKGIDVLIADTAGRLHTKSNLMEELSKIKRIMQKVDETAPHEVLLVLDAGTGQNALSQTKIFNETVELSGLAITKLDGTAKGGIIFSLANQFKLPIRFIGVGEGIDDLQDFNAKSFVDALFVKD